MQATQQFSAELLLKGQAVSLVFLDVDGVFTDGGLYLDAQGESIKRFHTLDGMGIQLLRQAGIEVVVITGMGCPFSKGQESTRTRLRLWPARRQ